MNTSDVLTALSESLPRLRQDFDVKSLAVFGSVARNESRVGSDLDVLVEFTHRPTFDAFMGLKIFLEERFGVRVDLATRNTLRTEIRAKVEREAIHVT